MKLDKNYIILFIIYLITILVVLYATFLYKKTNVFNYNDAIGMFIIDISDYNKLRDNIINYSFEKENFVIYYSAGKTESALREFIIDYDLSHEFLYVDNYNIVKKILNDFSEKKLDMEDETSIIYFNGGKVIDIVPCSSMKYEDYKNYFSKVGLI